MSGGSYNYFYERIEEFAGAISDVGGCPKACASPTLRQAFKDHLRKVAAAAHAIEWNDSLDGHDAEAELIRACLTPGAEVEAALHRAEQSLEALAQAVREAKARGDGGRAE